MLMDIRDSILVIEGYIKTFTNRKREHKELSKPFVFGGLPRDPFLHTKSIILAKYLGVFLSANSLASEDKEPTYSNTNKKQDWLRTA